MKFAHNSYEFTEKTVMCNIASEKYIEKKPY